MYTVLIAINRNSCDLGCTWFFIQRNLHLTVYSIFYQKQIVFYSEIFFHQITLFLSNVKALHALRLFFSYFVDRSEPYSKNVFITAFRFSALPLTANHEPMVPGLSTASATRLLVVPVGTCFVHSAKHEITRAPRDLKEVVYVQLYMASYNAMKIFTYSRLKTNNTEKSFEKRLKNESDVWGQLAILNLTVFVILFYADMSWRMWNQWWNRYWRCRCTTHCW